MATLQHCLSQDTTYADAHLLLAQIHQHRQNHAATAQYLDTALSYNFEVSCDCLKVYKPRKQQKSLGTAILFHYIILIKFCRSEIIPFII